MSKRVGAVGSKQDKRVRPCAQPGASSPKDIIHYLRNNLSDDELASKLALYKQMARGEDGGQVEAWSFDSIRSAVYPKWTDADFQSVCDAFDTPKK